MAAKNDCGICEDLPDKEREKLERAMLDRVPYRTIVERFAHHAVTLGKIFRHKKHLRKGLIAAHEKSLVEKVNQKEISHVDHMQYAYQRILNMDQEIGKIIKSNLDDRTKLQGFMTQLKAWHEAREQMRFLLELIGKIDPKTGQFVKGDTEETHDDDFSNMTSEELEALIAIAMEALTRMRAKETPRVASP